MAAISRLISPLGCRGHRFRAIPLKPLKRSDQLLQIRVYSRRSRRKLDASGTQRQQIVKKNANADFIQDDADCTSGVENDVIYMREALREAEKAALSGEVPVGAVMVCKGRIVARAHNCVEKEGDPTAHAEMMCIRRTAKKSGGWRLLDSTLYVTLEPCPMCAGALLQARVGVVVWGASNPLLGADGSFVSLFPRDNASNEGCSVANHGNIPAHPFNPNIKVRRGVLATDCAEIMKTFFRKRRESNQTSPANMLPLYHMKTRVLHCWLEFIKLLGFSSK